MSTFESYLIEKAKDGDNQAFNELFLCEQKYIFNLMYQLTGDVATADDLTQEALILAYRKLRSFRHEASFRTWLSKISVNVFRAEYRRRFKHVSICLDKIEVPAADNRPERIVIRREMQWCIAHTLQQHIPKRYRTVLVLRDLQNLSYREIAEILGWTISRTKTSLRRARQIFRNHFVNAKCQAFAEDYLCICEGIAQL